MKKYLNTMGADAERRFCVGLNHWTKARTQRRVEEALNGYLVYKE